MIGLIGWICVMTGAFALSYLVRQRIGLKEDGEQDNISGQCHNCQAKYELLNRKYLPTEKVVFYCNGCGKYQQVKMQKKEV